MGDNISRQGLLLQIEKDADGCPGWYGDTWQFIKTIKSMPSAEPKTGKWVKDDLGITICSECRRPRRDNRINHIKFCNSCGARMDGANYD